MDSVLSVDIYIDHDKVNEGVKSLLAVFRPTWCTENIDLKVCHSNALLVRSSIRSTINTLQNENLSLNVFCQIMFKLSGPYFSL